MDEKKEKKPQRIVVYSQQEMEKAIRLGEKLDIPVQAAQKDGNTDSSKGQRTGDAKNPALLELRWDSDGLSLAEGEKIVRGDFSKMISRIRHNNLSQELLIKAAKVKGKSELPLLAVDATAGLGEDAFLLAAAGFQVKMYERDLVIAALLEDALYRATQENGISVIASRMQLVAGDSLIGMPQMKESPDIILLDPMFPARQKSSLIKKKFQLLQLLEMPCADEEALLTAAMAASPYKIIIKRPRKGEYLANKKPDYSLLGKSIRYDCIVST